MVLSEAEIAKIAAKVGPPQADSWGRIEIPLDKIRDMRAAKFSMNQIADYFGVSRATVERRWLGIERAGEKRRTEAKNLAAFLSALNPPPPPD